MSGDSINTLKIVKEQPLNITDLEYTKRLLEPFEDIVIERFNNASIPSKKCPNSVFIFIAIGLVLFINFPKVREKMLINPYILWLISAVLLFGAIF